MIFDLTKRQSGITPTGSLAVTENDTYDVTQYAEAVVNVQPNLATLNATTNGTYTAAGDQRDLDGYSEVTVAVPITAIRDSGSYVQATAVTTYQWFDITHSLGKAAKIFYVWAEYDTSPVERVFVAFMYIGAFKMLSSNSLKPFSSCYSLPANATTVTRQGVFYYSNTISSIDTISWTNGAAANTIPAGTTINWEAITWDDSIS